MVKNIIVVSKEAIETLIFNFFEIYIVGFFSIKAQINASTKGSVYSSVPKNIVKI
jgi:hypothetical protein